MKALRIVNWANYEKSDARKCTTMQWVAVPVDHGGLSFLEMVSRPDGVRTMGAWMLILQVAARCPTRGLLITDSGRTIYGHEISLKTRANEHDVTLAISVLMEFGWIEEIDIPDTVRKASGSNPDYKTRQDITEQDKTEQHAPLAAAPVAEKMGLPVLCGPGFRVRDDSEPWRPDTGLIAVLTAAYPSADINGELAKAAAWCATTPKPKTVKGMPRFLNGWLNRNHTPAAKVITGPLIPEISTEQRELGLELMRRVKAGEDV